MPQYVIAVVVCLTAYVMAYPNHSKMELSSYPFPFISRAEWGANPATGFTKLATPVPFVVIHHTYIPAVCMTREQCVKDMRAMQNYHQNTNGWHDIGYNFAIGGEGSVYEGRGWEAVGAHASGTNSRSIGIALIGDFVSSLPPLVALQTAKQLIAEGIRRGYISPQYQLIGHREVSATECPGEALFEEIKSWEHYSGRTSNGTEHNSLTIITRAQWGANPPRSFTRLNTPVSHVVIHHTAVPGVCMAHDQCVRDMRSMQNTHQNTNGWADIGYNFAVGGEGSVYEGRGWTSMGAHAAGFNSQSIGIALIGNFVSELPPQAAINSAKRLISLGVQHGYIKPDYKLLGHRQVTATECPGDALFRDIQTWPQFSWTV